MKQKQAIMQEVKIYYKPGLFIRVYIRPEDKEKLEEILRLEMTS